MLYILHGHNFSARKKKLDELVSSFLKKKPDASVFRLPEERLTPSVIEELSQSQGLFTPKHVVILEGIFESEESTEIVLPYLSLVKDSENVFISTDAGIPAKILKEISVFAEKMQEFDGKKEAEPRFNIFALSDAVGKRDRKSAWRILLRAEAEGLMPEEILGTIFWQVKNMLALKNGKGATSSSTGLKPFVFTKSRAYSDNFSEDELKNLSKSLVRLYHDSHRGILDFELGLEKLILEAL